MIVEFLKILDVLHALDLLDYDFFEARFNTAAFRAAA